MGLKRIIEEYDNAPKHRKRVLLDHVLAVPEAGILNPIKAQTRGRLTGSTQRLLSQFEHVAATLEAAVRRRKCRTCQQTGQRARICCRQAQEAATPTTAAPLSVLTAPAATTVGSESPGCNFQRCKNSSLFYASV